MANRVGFIGCLVVVVAAMLTGGAAAETYTVGDALGWKTPPGGPIAYSTWARKQTFEIGDTLVFNWTGTQNVAEVSKSDFDNCTLSNIIGSLQSTSPANFTLDSNGTHYFICTIVTHCRLGQKLAATIGDTGSAPPLTATTLVLFLALAVGLLSHI